MDVVYAILLASLLFVVYTLYKIYSVDGFIDVYQEGYPTKQLCKAPLTSPLPELSGPADATLETPRVPYHLLGDYLEPATQEGRLANFSSECAYVADAQSRIEKTASYGQITNNYKRKKPDNGTTWLHELSLSFYK